MDEPEPHREAATNARAGPPVSGSLFAAEPPPAGAEAFETLFAGANVRVERIVSNLHASPEGFWYEQPDDEWVAVVRGDAVLAFADGEPLSMRAGDWVVIPAGCRHRVASTGPDTVWVALHVAPRADAGR